MATIKIVRNSEQTGLGDGFRRALERRKLIHLGDDAEIVISGLKDGMQSGKPSMMFGFVLPDGRHVIAETSWRLFASAFWAFAEQFGEERPNMEGTAVEFDSTGAGHRVRLEVRSDDLPNVFTCELCGKRRDEPPGEEGGTALLQWIHRHFREKHPDWTPPK